MAQPGWYGHAIVLANVTPTRQAERSMTKARRHEGGAMKSATKSSGTLPIAVSAAIGAAEHALSLNGHDAEVADLLERLRAAEPRFLPAA